MTEQQRQAWRDRFNACFLFQAVIFQFLWAPMLSIYSVYRLCRVFGWFGKSVFFWAMISPAIYLSWFFILLVCYCVETTVIGWFWEKPRREQQKGPNQYSPSFGICQVFYNRIYALYSLPFAKFLLHAPVFGPMILRSYSTKIHLGRESFIAGQLWDPDLVIFGDCVVLGGDCTVMGHLMVRDGKGLMIYQTALVEFGDYCVIGGEARIEMGAKIGARSVVEPRSHVQPYTIIPPDEVWGGVPAVFHAKRDYAITGKTMAAPAVQQEVDVCGLIAMALSLPAGSIMRESTSSDCELWDSMGKMAIAAALHDRLNINLTPQEVFGLNSVELVEKIVSAKRNEGFSSTKISTTEINADFLPLLDPVEATKLLAEKYHDAPVEMRAKTKVVVAATFVAQPMASALQLWSRACGCPVEVAFYDFNQVPQALLDRESLLGKNEEGLNVVLVRPEDFSLGQEMETAKQLIQAVKNFVECTGNALLVSDLPMVVSVSQQISPTLESLRAWWRERLQEIKGVQILGFAEIVEELGKVASRDTQMELEASTPYSAAVYQRLGIGVARAVRQMRVPAKKVLALDCDNTLWGGVIGEDGLEGIDLGKFKLLQTQILELKARGILLVIVSKNTEADVWQVLENHPETILRRKDFVAWRINWQPKSENLRALAKELNLGLDSFVLLDDSPAERLEIAANCPGVTVVPLGNDSSAYVEILRKLWLFDGAGTTGEDAKRNEFVAQENERKESEKSAVNLESYLASLELKVEIRKAREEDLPRVHQLVQKTNQFNLSLKRRSLPEIKTLSPQHDIWVLSASDKFGSYGMVGCCITRCEGDAFILDSLLLSCRALGRGIEEAFLHVLGQKAAKAGAKRLRADFVKGPKNQPMGEFLTKVGFDQLNEINVVNIPNAPTHLVLKTPPA